MRRLAAALSALLWLAGCLPGDERPEPASLLVNVNRSDAAVDGLVTDDGWRISFQRFLAALGDMELDGDDCVDYSQAQYDRLYDFAVADTSRLAQHYALGDCNVSFAVRSPSLESILMDGATAVDRGFMTRLEMDAFVTRYRAPVSLWIEGSAEKEGTIKRFSWAIRRAWRISRCYTPTGDDTVNHLDLFGGESLERPLAVRPKELFRLTPSLEAPIEFGRFAEADADRDGNITFEELAEVEVSRQDIVDDVVDEIPRGGLDIALGAVTELSLGSLVYELLSQRVVAFADAGECELGLGFRF